MKTTKYFLVSNAQFFIMSLLIGIIASAVLIINSSVKDYLELPIVQLSQDGKCVSVSSYKNGEAFSCNDVGIILRNYRIKKSNV